MHLQGMNRAYPFEKPVSTNCAGEIIVTDSTRSGKWLMFPVTKNRACEASATSTKGRSSGSFSRNLEGDATTWNAISSRNRVSERTSDKLNFKWGRDNTSRYSSIILESRAISTFPSNTSPNTEAGFPKGLRSAETMTFVSTTISIGFVSVLLL